MFRIILLSLTSRDVSFQFWHSEPSFSYNSMFRASIASQLRRLESSFIVWHSQPPYLLSLGVQSHPSQFLIQSRIFSSAFRATIFFFSQAFRATISYSSMFRATIPSQFGVQSHHLFSVWRLEPHLQFGVQSHYFLSLAFRAMFSIWHSESHLQLGVQSQCPFIVWCSELSSYHDRVFVATFSAFRAIVHSQEFKVVVHSQSLEPSYLQFEIQIHQSVCHSKPPFSSSSTFGATFLAFRVPSIQSCLSFLVRNSEPHSQHLKFFFSFSSVFRATLLAFRIAIFFQFSIQSHSYRSKPLSSVLGVQSRVFILTFKAIVQLGIRCHHPPLVLAFRAVVHTHSGIQSHHLSSFWCSESFFPNLVIHSHGSQHSSSLALHILLSRFYVRPHFPHLVTSCLSFVHRVLLNLFHCT